MIESPYRELLDTLAEDYRYLAGDIVLRTDPSKKLPMIEFLPTYSNSPSNQVQLPKTCIKWHNVFIPIEIVALYLDPRKVVVPNRHRILYKDGDFRNYDPSNLYVISDVAHKLLTTLGHIYTPKLTKGLGYHAFFSSDSTAYDLGYHATQDMAQMACMTAKLTLYTKEQARLSSVYSYTPQDWKKIESLVMTGVNINE